jgi:hypothetical protein
VVRVAPSLRRMRTGGDEVPSLGPALCVRSLDRGDDSRHTSCSGCATTDRNQRFTPRKTKGATMTDPPSKPALALVHNQAALARKLLDELEPIAPRFDSATAPSAQAIEELSRLSCRIIEAAAILALEGEAQRTPRLAKFLQAETQPVGVEFSSHVPAAAECGRA